MEAVTLSYNINQLKLGQSQNDKYAIQPSLHYMCRLPRQLARRLDI
jgi:hypothetical protein